MPFVSIDEGGTVPTELYFEDYGSGPPVVLIHGWPLDGRSWERQIPALLDAGFRVVAYDRRGFGRSSRPLDGYDYDRLAADLDRLLTELDLTDVTLIGFSMGGGEVARYIGRYGTQRLARVVFIGAVTPFLLRTSDNPDGVNQSVFDGIAAGLRADRPAFLAGFFEDFFNADRLRPQHVSDRAIEMHWLAAIAASPFATEKLVRAWSATDFRADLTRASVPALIIHGADDRAVPLAIGGERTHAMLPGSRLVVIEDGPHALPWTHAAQVNAAILDFARQPQPVAR